MLCDTTIVQNFLWSYSRHVQYLSQKWWSSIWAIATAGWPRSARAILLSYRVFMDFNGASDKAAGHPLPLSWEADLGYHPGETSEEHQDVWMNHRLS